MELNVKLIFHFLSDFLKKNGALGDSPKNGKFFKNKPAQEAEAYFFY